MFKFMKYEIKGTFRFMLALIATVLFASTAIQLVAHNSMKNFNSMDTTVGEGLLVGIMFLMIFGAFVTSLFYIVSSFRKELYEDRGYLTFSLPLTGKQIVSSKLIIAYFWSLAIALSAIVYNLILGIVLFGTKWIEAFKYITNMIPGNLIVSIGIAGLVSSITTLLLIYFSITLSKVSIRNKKIGGLWFIIFLVLGALISYATAVVGDVFPYYMDLTSFRIVKLNQLLNDGNLTTNIAASIFSVLIGVGTFFGTSYLIENKIDL